MAASRTRSPAIQDFEFRARDAAFHGKALVAELKHRAVRPRQRRLGRGHRLIQRIAETILDQRDQIVQTLGVLRCARHLGDGAQGPRRAHQRQQMPAREAGVILRWHRQRRAHHLVSAAFAEQWRDGAVDDAEVEHVAGDADAGMASGTLPPRGSKRMTEKSLVPPPKSPIKTVACAVRVRAKRVPAASGSSASVTSGHPASA